MTDLIGVRVDEVDEFLAHFGVPGMKWGHRKPGVISTGGGSRRATPQGTRHDRRVASGQAITDKYKGSTGRAIAHLAGRHVAETILMNIVGTGINHIPSAPLRNGARAASLIVGAGMTVKNINDAVKVGQAAKARKQGK